MSLELIADLTRLAEKTGVSFSDYCTAVLKDYAERNALVTIETRVSYPNDPEVSLHPSASVLEHVQMLKAGTTLEKVAAAAKAKVLKSEQHKKAPKEGRN